MVFIVARENPKILKVTSLQLIFFSFNSFKISSAVNLLLSELKSHLVLFRSDKKIIKLV